MDFFQHQERARRRTGLLVIYFILAIVAVVFSVTAALLAMLYFAGIPVPLQAPWSHPFSQWIVAGTLLIIIGGCLIKSWQLRKGGSALAEMMGAQPLGVKGNDPAEQRLINVVEEMSIAAGIPAPRTYVLDNETAINAFAAGFRPGEAVLVVTRGVLERFSREELQALVGHEFSHILNADIRINLRMVSVLAGILAVGKVGEYLLHSHRHRSSRRNNKGNLVVLGLVLMVIGYVGLFFGRLIKAAISRQRELLADASAVQFTRNPAGLAGALIQVRNHGGSTLNNRHAEDMSHMCFALPVKMHLQRWLSTHPPVDERLAALGDGWVARARARARQQPEEGVHTGAGQQVPDASVSAGFADTGGDTPPPASATGHTASRVGTVLDADLHYAQSLLQRIPASLRHTLRQPRGARQVLLALVVASNRSDKQPQLSRANLAHESQQLLPLADTLAELGPEGRLPVIDLAMPALKAAPQQLRDDLLKELDALARADQRFSLFEWTLLALARQQLGRNASRNRPTRFHRYGAVAAELQLLFSVLTWASGEKDEQARSLFEQHTRGLLPAGRTLLPLRQCNSEKLFRAMERLADLSPLLKGPIIDSATDMALDDGALRVPERELLRAVASLMACPLPPCFTRNQASPPTHSPATAPY